MLKLTTVTLCLVVALFAMLFQMRSALPTLLINMKAGWFISRFSEQLRAPQPGSLLGWLARKGMAKHNAESAAKMIELLHPRQSSVIVEIGPGHGMSLQKLLKEYQPLRVHGIEISDAFRRDLEIKFAKELSTGILTIHKNDAKDLSFLADSSVDYIYGLNVIYFLNPLSEYLAEFHRILKPGATLLFGASARAVNLDPKYFINTDWDACVDALAKAGFEHATKGEPIPTNTDRLIPISARKKESLEHLNKESTESDGYHAVS